MTNGKTLAVTNTLTLSGTDSTTMTFPTTSATIARTDAAQTFTGNQTISSGVLVIPNTSFQTPGIQLGSTTTGINAFNSGGTIVFVNNGTARLGIQGTHIVTTGASAYSWRSDTDVTSAPDTLLYRGGAAATIQMGADVNAAATAQTFKSARGITGTDKAGAPFHFASGEGTGAATVSYIDFATPTVLGSSATQQTNTVRATIDSAGVKCAVPLWLSNAAVTGLVAGVLAASTNASIVIYDSAGQAYRIPCII